MRLKLKIDGKLTFMANFRPARRPFGGGGFEATFGEAGRDGAATRLERGEDGSLAIANGSEIALDVAGSPRFAIPGGVAQLVNRDDGFTLTADGDVPLALRQDADGVVLVVGDQTSTLVRDRLDRGGVSAQVSNRGNGADVTQDAILDVDVHNFSRPAAVRQAQAKARRIQSVINRGLLSRGQP